MIERELRVKAGDPFSLSAINESQRRLAALGLFRRARISELRHGGETTRDLLVTIEEAPPTTVDYGGGVEGKLRAYKIHLGSGNILMEPNDRYLCIVPAPAAGASVRLPFEGDNLLSIILSRQRCSPPTTRSPTAAS